MSWTPLFLRSAVTLRQNPAPSPITCSVIQETVSADSWVPFSQRRRRWKREME
jgi:hypothetical protein